MPQIPRDHAAVNRRRIFQRQLIFRQWLCAALGAIALVWLADVSFHQTPWQTPWLAQALLALVSVLAAAGAIVHRLRVWHRPIRRCKSLLPRIVAGIEPIESLSALTGPIADLVPALQDALRAMRQGEVKIQQLNAELSQRVASRTDALERTIGSLRNQATRDALTTLLNRRALDQAFPPLLDRCKLQKRDLCVLMGDVDHFKKLNDALGHHAGDDFLRGVGQLIRSSLRPDDLAFRCGGDEFIILLPACDPPEARRIAARLQNLVEQLAKPLKLDPTPRLSLGLSALSLLPDATVAILTQAADQRLYKVKHTRLAA